MAKSFLDDAVAQYSMYKFVITFENHIGPRFHGWWTERMLTAKLARAVPVYGGTAEMKEFLSRFINVDAVIWCEFQADYSSGTGPATEEAPYLKYLFRCAFHSAASGATPLTRWLLRASLTTVHTPHHSPPTGTPLQHARCAAQYPYNASDPEMRVEKTKRVFRAELDACVAQIKRVDNDDALWAKIASTSLLPDNTVEGTIFDEQRVARNLRDAICSLNSYLCE